jgi:ribosome-associated protein
MRSSRASLKVGPELVIPADELVVQTARSGGPGGQNVNKVESKVVLRYDVRRSRILTEHQRLLLLERLAGRLTREGELVLHSSRHREQRRNAEAARERLLGILQEAMAPRLRRKETLPKASAREKRLKAKRTRSVVKRARSRPGAED